MPFVLDDDLEGRVREVRPSKPKAVIGDDVLVDDGTRKAGVHDEFPKPCTWWRVASLVQAWQGDLKRLTPDACGGPWQGLMQPTLHGETAPQHVVAGVDRLRMGLSSRVQGRASPAASSDALAGWEHQRAGRVVLDALKDEWLNRMSIRHAVVRYIEDFYNLP